MYAGVARVRPGLVGRHLRDGQRFRQPARDEASVRAVLASIVEFSEDAILARTPEGTILTWNDGAERISGYRAEEVLGQSVLMLAQRSP